MRLLFGTKHVKGLEVFRDTQYSVEREQPRLRHRISELKDSILPLYPAETLAEMDAGNDGVGCRMYRRAAADRIRRRLAKRQSDRFGNLKTGVLEHIPVRTTEIKDVLLELKRKGIVDYTLSGRARKPDDKTIIKLVSA